MTPVPKPACPDSPVWTYFFIPREVGMLIPLTQDGVLSFWAHSKA